MENVVPLSEILLSAAGATGHSLLTTEGALVLFVIETFAPILTIGGVLELFINEAELISVGVCETLFSVK